MRTALTWICAIGGAMLVACDEKAGPTPAPTAPEVSGGARVRLLEPGAEPRRALRYRLGAEERRLELTLERAFTVRTGDIELPEVRIPALELGLAVQPGPALDGGGRRVAFRLDATRVVPHGDALPSVVEELGAELGRLRGLAGAWALSPRGLAREAEALLPPDAKLKILDGEAEEIRQQLLGLVIPLPEEAVGLGARWEVRAPLTWEWLRLGAEVFAFRGEQTAIYRLEALEDGRLGLAVELTRVFPAQEQMPDNPVGSPGRLEAWEGRGSGRLSVDLASPLPEGSLTLTSHKRMTGRPRGPSGPARETTTLATIRVRLLVRKS